MNVTTIDPTTIQHTPEDLLKLGDRGKGVELVDGQYVRKAMGSESGLVNCFVIRFLSNYVSEKSLGWIFDSNTGYQCFPRSKRVRKPDTSFVRKDRLSAEKIPKGWMKIAPDLAVEVLSPRDRAGELNAKLVDYRKAGIPLVWVIDPETRTVVVHESGNPLQRLLESTDTLTGDDVIPGFSIKVADLFPPTSTKE